jgi:ribA/ribD-fused uncharacterized protein
MVYDKEWAYNEYISTIKRPFIYFWNHKPERNGVISKNCLSQWWCNDDWKPLFKHEGIDYPTAEHWMMAEKARIFGDHKTENEIIKSSDAFAAKELGKKVRNYRESVWRSKRTDVVIKGNILKFSQNEKLKDFLINTGDSILVEASPYDYIWGVGLKETQSVINNPYMWKGLNLLGFSLMEVRDKIT